MSDQEFIPGPNQGEWIKNPAFTGNKWELFRKYPVRLLRGRFGYGPARKGAPAWVERVPSGHLYLSWDGQVFCFDAKEGVDFRIP